MKKILLSVALAVTSASALAAEMPEAGARDARVRYVEYKKDDVTVINVRRGAVTRIVLGDDEKILATATGFGADCRREEAEWCVRAEPGTNQIWVKPKEGATHNNLELKTDRRDYSFDFRVLKDAVAGARKDLSSEPMFRVMFRYPIVVPPLAAFLNATATRGPQVSESTVVAHRIAAAKPIARNWNYTMDVLEGAEQVAPALVFDDGRFTYFQFPANRQVPSIFYISPKGEEARVSYHMEDDLAVVQRLGQRFVLRLGEAVVGIWNDSFDPDGVAPVDGVTVQGIKRELKGGDK